MSFFRKRGSQILIGAALLAIATGAFTIIKSEENRLRNSIVSCERTINEQTKNGVPQELEKRQALSQAIQQRQELQEEHQNLASSETNLQEVIKKIENLEDYSPKAEDNLRDKELRDVNKVLDLINVLERFNDEQVQNLYDLLKEYNKEEGHFGRIKPQIPEALTELIPEDLRKDFRDFVEMSSMTEPNYELFLAAAYKWAIREVSSSLDTYVNRDKFLLSEVQEVSYGLLKLTQSKNIPDLKPYTARVNKINEAIDSTAQKNQAHIVYIKGKIEEIRKKAKRRNIDIEE